MEYFIVANSFAAPFCSDQSTHYVEGETPEAALLSLLGTYSHPFGLYAATAWSSADAYHKDQRPLAGWRSNFEIALQEGKSGHEVKNPKQGRVVPL